jgi:hypothetical protein
MDRSEAMATFVRVVETGSFSAAPRHPPDGQTVTRSSDRSKRLMPYSVDIPVVEVLEAGLDVDTNFCRPSVVVDPDGHERVTDRNLTFEEHFVVRSRKSNYSIWHAKAPHAETKQAEWRRPVQYQ